MTTKLDSTCWQSFPVSEQLEMPKNLIAKSKPEFRPQRNQIVKIGNTQLRNQNAPRHQISIKKSSRRDYSQETSTFNRFFNTHKDGFFIY